MSKLLKEKWSRLAFSNENRGIQNEGEDATLLEGNWIPSDDELDNAEMYVMSDCFEVLELTSKLMKDKRLYSKASYEDFLMECIEWIKREGLEGKQILRDDYL